MDIKQFKFGTPYCPHPPILSPYGKHQHQTAKKKRSMLCGNPHKFTPLRLAGWGNEIHSLTVAIFIMNQSSDATTFRDSNNIH